MKALRVLVLLVSISAASVLVWNATRNKGGSNEETFGSDEMIGSSKSMPLDMDLLHFEPVDMQASPKSGPIILPDEVAEIVEGKPSEVTVTDEEVKKMRDSMLSTSKSGIIMSDDKIRELLENQKKVKLMPSSKSLDAVLVPLDLRGIVEGGGSEKEKEPKLIPSTKNPIRLVEPKDLEKIIEPGESDFNKPVEPEK